MDKFNSAEEVLDFAIARETEAHEFYEELANEMENSAMREIFEDFAKEELGHKVRLEEMKKDRIEPVFKDVMDLKISDYVVGSEPTANMTYQEALILAMKKEKAAFKLYTRLAAMAKDSSLCNTFLLLAQEEAKHKLRFEIEYDDEILKEN